MSGFKPGDVLYQNPLACEADIRGFRIEGHAATSFPLGRLRLENTLSPEEGQAANFLFWCPEDFPPDIAVSWDFMPIREPGLAMVWCGAGGRNGEDLFDPSLQPRTGEYKQYHSGDINAYHLSYFRRRLPREREFHTCNLRKSYGFHMVSQGADPLPSVDTVASPYRIELVKCGPHISFSVDELPILQWKDDGKQFGPVLGGGKLGFRQMAPLIAEYANLVVRSVESG